MTQQNYAAPEVLQVKPYGRSVDLWSYGVIVFSLITGELPFDDQDESELAK